MAPLMALSWKCKFEKPKLSIHVHKVWLFLKITTAMTQVYIKYGWILTKQLAVAGRHNSMAAFVCVCVNKPSEENVETFQLLGSNSDGSCPTEIN